MRNIFVIRGEAMEIDVMNHFNRSFTVEDVNKISIVYLPEALLSYEPSENKKYKIIKSILGEDILYFLFK